MRIWSPNNPNDWDDLGHRVIRSSTEMQIVKERFSVARDQLRLEGRYYLGGPIAYGWAVENKNYVPKPKEVKILKIMLRLRKKEKSHDSIARYLNERRIKPRKAKVWLGSTIKDILKRPINAGFYKWKDKQIKSNSGKILEKEDYWAIQKKAKKTGPKKPKTMLTGLGIMHCECGSAMVYHPKQQRKRKDGSQGAQHKYFRCNHRSKGEIGECKKSGLISTYLIVEPIMKELKSIAQDGKVIDECMRQLDETNPLIEEQKIILDQIKTIESVIKNFINALAQGEPFESIKNELREKENELRNLQNQYQALNNRIESEYLKKDKTEIRRKLTEFSKNFEKLPMTDQGNIISSFIESIIVSRKYCKVKYTFPIDGMLEHKYVYQYRKRFKRQKI